MRSSSHFSAEPQAGLQDCGVGEVAHCRSCQGPVPCRQEGLGRRLNIWRQQDTLVSGAMKLV
jgi:hypothetical protein